MGEQRNVLQAEVAEARGRRWRIAATIRSALGELDRGSRPRNADIEQERQYLKTALAELLVPAPAPRPSMIEKELSFSISLVDRLEEKEAQTLDSALGLHR